MPVHRLMLFLCGWLLTAGTVTADPQRLVDPGNPGPDLPPSGRSLFDLLTITDGRQQVPYPFERLIERLASHADRDAAYLGRPVKAVLIPLGRSLQRAAAAPDFFASPRIVATVDAPPPPADAGGTVPLLLQDRLYVGYMPAADVLEVVSYNERDARFEFQLVTDYREDATPKVVYARRIVCIACHQNHAPIFARPLWDETNANREIAAHLASERSAFFGVAVRGGVDIAYAIDNATDRANGFALTQMLWNDGCGSGDAGQRCRASLLTAALQYALSGGRGFAANHALEAYMATIRAARWPDGLLLPAADIPNRRPLAVASAPGIDPADAIRDAADVDASVEPLGPRDGEQLWQPPAAEWAARAVSGLAAFLAPVDLQSLLGTVPGDRIVRHELQAGCELSGDAVRRLSVACTGRALQLTGVLLREAPAQNWRGRLHTLVVNGTDFGTVGVEGRSRTTGISLALPAAAANPSLRLSDGNAIEDMVVETIQPTDTGADRLASLRMVIREDFEPIRTRIEVLLHDEVSGLDASPFQRTQLLTRLIAPVGAAASSPHTCCAEPGEPPMQVTPPEPELAADPLLDPFIDVCGACHRSTEPFPPNFLSGTAPEVHQRIAQCAERIQYRLAMWDLPPSQRPKTPMPPHAAHHIGDDELGPWRSGPLARLRDALHTLAEQNGRRLPSDKVTIDRPYASLRHCDSPAAVEGVHPT